MTEGSVAVAARVRVATADDAPVIRSFSCAPRIPRYEHRAERLIQRSGSILAGDIAAPTGFGCLVVEDAANPDSEIIGVSVLMDAGRGLETVCEWVVMGIARDHQSRRVLDGRSLAAAFGAETALHAQAASYTRMLALVHTSHGKSRHILEDLGFTNQERADFEYDVFAVSLAL